MSLYHILQTSALTGLAWQALVNPSQAREILTQVKPIQAREPLAWLDLIIKSSSIDLTFAWLSSEALGFGLAEVYSLEKIIFRITTRAPFTFC